MPHSTPDSQTIRPIPIVAIGAKTDPPPPPRDESVAPDAGPHGFTINADSTGYLGIPRDHRPLTPRGILMWTAGTIAGALCFATTVALVHSHHDSAAEHARVSEPLTRTDVVTGGQPAMPHADAVTTEPAPAAAPTPVIPLAALPLAPRPKVATSKPRLAAEQRKAPARTVSKSLTVHATTRAPAPAKAKTPPQTPKERAAH